MQNPKSCPCAMVAIGRSKEESKYNTEKDITHQQLTHYALRVHTTFQSHHLSQSDTGLLFGLSFFLKISPSQMRSTLLTAACNLHCMPKKSACP
jgi:hypothetical protein